MTHPNDLQGFGDGWEDEGDPQHQDHVLDRGGQLLHLGTVKQRVGRGRG